MLDIHSLLGKLKRPRLLVRAARFGIDDFRRERDLHKLLECETLPRPGAAILQLLDYEAELNHHRVSNDANYAIARHIETLTAIMSEARLLQATTRPRPDEVT